MLVSTSLLWLAVPGAQHASPPSRPEGGQDRDDALEPSASVGIPDCQKSVLGNCLLAVVLSPAEFDRLEEQDRIRREAKVRLRETISLIQREAAEHGLTDVELERLMADESRSEQIA
jgi:hypothetical protein